MVHCRTHEREKVERAVKEDGQALGSDKQAML